MNICVLLPRGHWGVLNWIQVDTVQIWRGEKGEYVWKGQSRKHDVKNRCWALPLTLTVMYGSMHCPASFRPIFSIVSVSKVIPGSEGNRGNRVPVKDVKLSLKPWPKNKLTNEILFAYWQIKWINWLFLKVSQEVVYGEKKKNVITVNVKTAKFIYCLLFSY